MWLKEMLQYESQVLAEIKKLLETVEFAQKKIHGIDPAISAIEQRTEAEHLETTYLHLKGLLPDGVESQELDRHFDSTIRDLRAGQNPYMDIAHLVANDLPSLEERFVQWAAEPYDAELARKTDKLLRGQHLDSAVRKAFVILKERIVANFGVSAKLDGSDLVNAVFAKTGKMAGKIPEDELQALRNLLDGLYGVFRNKYSHNSVSEERHEAEAVLAMINWALIEMDRLKV